MMPPSRCCTVRRLPSGLITPGAIAAPARGAAAAHQAEAAEDPGRSPGRRADRTRAARPSAACRRCRRTRDGGRPAPAAADRAQRRHRHARRHPARITMPPPPPARSAPRTMIRARISVARAEQHAGALATAPASCRRGSAGAAGGRPESPCVPRALSRPIASTTALSPTWSRLALGSSSTTTRGAPNIARASPMHCRWPPESDRRPAARPRSRSRRADAGSSRARRRAAPPRSRPRPGASAMRAMLSRTLPANSSTSCGR